MLGDEECRYAGNDGHGAHHHEEIEILQGDAQGIPQESHGDECSQSPEKGCSHLCLVVDACSRDACVEVGPFLADVELGSPWSDGDAHSRLVDVECDPRQDFDGFSYICRHVLDG